MLRQHGYGVLEARHGIDALMISSQHIGRVDLLITDLIMPQMSGRDLAEQLTLVRSEMKVLYVSGYTDKMLMGREELQPPIAFLSKPFTSEALIQKVREVLDGTSSPPARDRVGTTLDPRSLDPRS